MTDYKKLNEHSRYQLLAGDMVACEEWTVLANGGPEQGGKGAIILVPLPDCPADRYDGYMRQMREVGLQKVRNQFRQMGMPGPVRLRIVNVKKTFIPADQIDWSFGR